MGSVSGGCVEGAVYELAKEVVATGEPIAQRYGVSDDDAFAVGPDLRRHPRRVRRAGRRGSRSPSWGTSPTSIDAHEPVAVATVVKGPATGSAGGSCSGRTGRRGTLGLQRLDDAVADDARGHARRGQTGLLHVGHDGERRGDDLTLFVHSFAPPARMLVFGAIDFAAAVARVGDVPRLPRDRLRRPPGVRHAEALPRRDEVVVEWPHRYLRRRSTPAGSTSAP